MGERGWYGNKRLSVQYPTTQVAEGAPVQLGVNVTAAGVLGGRRVDPD